MTNELLARIFIGLALYGGVLGWLLAFRHEQ